jgi:DNA-directed RNA polymerase subunit RPC12/RpoP
MDVSCETCGRELHVKMSKLRKSPMLTCTCGQKIEIDASQLDREMRKVDAAEKGLDDALKGFPKTIGG